MCRLFFFIVYIYEKFFRFGEIEYVILRSYYFVYEKLIKIFEYFMSIIFVLFLKFEFKSEIVKSGLDEY